jgi:MerR family transcriptional regulator, repressor of the yfmOP operon
MRVLPSPAAPPSTVPPSGPAGSPETLLGIGRAAQACGVSERALRYYEQIGLLTPSGRTPGGLRRYSEGDVARVRRIRELQAHLGFNLDEIRVILDNDDRLAAVRAEYRSTRTGIARRRELLREVLAIHQTMATTVDTKMAALQGFRADVDASIQRVEGLLAEMEGAAAAPDVR